MSKYHRWIPALIATMVLLTGCRAAGAGNISAPPRGAADGGSHSQPEIGPLSTVTDQNAVVLPLDRYFPSTRDRFTAQQAMNILVNNCMAKHGFTFQLGIQTVVSWIDHRPFGPSDLALVQQYGYDIPWREPIDHIDGIEMQRPTDAEKAVLYGSTQIGPRPTDSKPGGCFGQASTQIEQGAPTSTVDLGQLEAWQNAAAASALADDRLAQVAEKWSECMAAEGYQFVDPAQAATEGGSKGRLTTLDHIHQAVTDVECKTTSRYVDMGMALMAAYEQQVVEDHAEDLADYLRQQQKQAENAATIIAGSSMAMSSGG